MKSYTYDSDITKVEHIYGCKVTKKSRINRQNIRIFIRKVIYLRKNHIFIAKSLRDSPKSYIFAFSYLNGDDAVFLYRNLGGC